MDNSIGAFTHDEGFSASLSTMEPISGEMCDFANAASGDVHTHRIEPRCNDQWKFAESVAIVEGCYRNTSWISEA